jgi:hypothetical protein
MIAASFQAAYQAQIDAANAAAANAAAMNAAAANTFAQPLTPDVKQQIAAEVQYQLQQQQMQAQSQGAAGEVAPAVAPTGLPILDSHQHTLQVYTSMNVVGVSGGECALTESDILQFNGAQPTDGVNASAYVRYSKSQDCPANTMVSVPVDQLQEMSNHMLEVMEQGLNDFQQKQGQDNLPRLTPAMTATTPAPFADAIPAAEPNVQAELQQTAAEGAQALNGIPTQETTATPYPGAQPAMPQPGMQPGIPATAPVPQNAASSSDVGLGQTPDQVKAAWGQPTRQANVGPKLIYFYKDSKVTFQNGVVVDIN